MQQGQQTAAQGIPALQAAQGQFDPSTSNYQQFYDQYQADVTKQGVATNGSRGCKSTK